MTKQSEEPVNQKVKQFTDLEAAIIDAIQDRKGRKITLIDFKGHSTPPASSFIVCQGNSTSQVSALADNIREEVQKNLHRKPYHYDGYRNSQWIVLDYGETIVHVFLPDTREYYNIEDLWSDARQTEIPDLD